MRPTLRLDELLTSGRDSDFLLVAKGSQPGLQRAVCNTIQRECPATRDRTRLLKFLPP